jgi:hypothetical protein
MSSMGVYLFLFVKDVAVGMMHLVDSRLPKKLVGKKSWQVMNVYLKPEYRNQRLGLELYDYVLHHKKQAFASGAAMTPSSRRIYTSNLKNPSVDVYALIKGFTSLADMEAMWDVGRDVEPEYDRRELHVGPDGVTTGEPGLDRVAIFVMVAHK